MRGSLARASGPRGSKQGSETSVFGGKGCMFATDTMCAMSFGNRFEDTNLRVIECASLDIEKCAKGCHSFSCYVKSGLAAHMITMP